MNDAAPDAAGGRYTTLEYLQQRYDLIGRRLAYTARTAAAHRGWKDEVRAQLGVVLGLHTMRLPQSEPAVDERIELDGYVRERVVLETEPGVLMPVYVLVPTGARAGDRRPAVLTPHGHSSGGKAAVVGRVDLPLVAETVATYNYDYAVQFVREGFVVLAPDARGFGERREWMRQGDGADRYLHGSCEVLNHMAMPLGQTVLGMWTWDLMRLLDYAQTRVEVDPERVGCAGLSGGGMQTLWLAALDERVKCAVVSGYFYGVKDSLLHLAQNCSCNYVPHLWELVDMGDVGALVAPRPLLIETGDQDDLNGPRGIHNVVEQVDVTRDAYRLVGAEEHLAHDVFAGGHRWRGAAALPWLVRHLRAPSASTAGPTPALG
jgi:dienelactone hydrolase